MKDLERFEDTLIRRGNERRLFFGMKCEERTIVYIAMPNSQYAMTRRIEFKGRKLKKFQLWYDQLKVSRAEKSQG